MWWLERAEGESQVDDSEDEIHFYLMVNGQRARSASSKQLFGHVISIQRSEKTGEVKFIFEENKGANACIQEMTPTDDFPTKEVPAIIEGFAALTQSVLVIPETQPNDASTDDTNGTQSTNTQSTDTQLTSTQSEPEPMMSSTPIPQKRSRSQNDSRKRIRSNSSNSFSSDSSDSDKENSFSVEAKCKGRHKVNVNQLLKAPDGMLAKKVLDDSIEPIKTVLRENRPQQLPIIPVMSTAPWTGVVTSQDKFIVLGGYSLFMAAKDLSTDVKFADYRQLSVHIFCDVTGDEIHQVEALFGLQTSLLKDGKETLHSRVAAFREMLFGICGADRHMEPPKPRQKVTAQWRRMCAASIGYSTDYRTLKPLEPTFQIAQYSNRCFEKVSRLFQIGQEKGKELKQSVFLPLQGLREEERFALLSAAVSGDIALKDIRRLAKTKKLLLHVKEEMVVQLGTSSWAEVQELYPLHSTEDILKPYRGLDFKKSLPRSFLKLLESAKSWKKKETSFCMPERLQFCRRAQQVQVNDHRIGLAFVNIRTDSDLIEVEGILQSRTTLVCICENVVLAGRTVEQLNGKPHTYSVLLSKEDGKVKHLISVVWRADGIEETPPQLETVLRLSEGFFRTLVERFSTPDDTILIYGPITDAVVAAHSESRRASIITESHDQEQSIRRIIMQQTIADISDPFTYDDDDDDI